MTEEVKWRREGTWKAGEILLVIGIISILLGLFLFIILANLGVWLIIASLLLLFLGRKRRVKMKARDK
ncbi:MAG: hypothetical protein M3M89_07185 [Thermoproteota archaeon]|nr:hypothetical protein [Thermoproteota archaeon]